MYESMIPTGENHSGMADGEDLRKAGTAGRTGGVRKEVDLENNSTSKLFTKLTCSSKNSCSSSPGSEPEVKKKSKREDNSS